MKPVRGIFQSTWIKDHYPILEIERLIGAGDTIYISYKIQRLMIPATLASYLYRILRH